MKSKKYKKFKDLQFTIDADYYKLRARLKLTAKYYISVITNISITYGSAYGNLRDQEFEVAMFKNNEMIKLGEYDDVLGWQTSKQITKLMKKYQKGK